MKTRPTLPENLQYYQDVVVPILLFHYTDFNGLKGIVENREIWATHTGFLNDLSELHHASKIALSLLHSDETSFLDPEVRKGLIRELEVSPIPADPRYFVEMYVACFTENGPSRWSKHRF